MKASKVVRPSSSGVECICMEVHGRDLTCGLSPSKLHQLTQRTQAMLQRGVATGVKMARMVGYWSWAFPRSPASDATTRGSHSAESEANSSGAKAIAMRSSLSAVGQIWKRRAPAVSMKR